MSLLFFSLLRVAWTSTYTYILLFFVAAAFVAYIARPRGRGEAVKKLFAGTLLFPDQLHEKEAAVGEPFIHIHCGDNGHVVFRRVNVDNLTASGAVSLAVTFKGKDVEIVERDTPGFPNDARACGAAFDIDMTGYEWRHVKWIDEDSGLWCAFTLHVREGIDFVMTLRR